MKSSAVILYCCSIIHSSRAFSISRVAQPVGLKLLSSLPSRMAATDEVHQVFNNIIEGANWIDLDIPASELRPNYTLIMGQCFNWKRIESSDTEGVVSSCWVGILDAHPLAIRQIGNSTLFAHLLDKRTTGVTVKHEGAVKHENIDAYLSLLLRDYFQTDYSLETLYRTWAGGCDRMRVVTETLKGVRVVRQDPFECLISFICSSNNNIKRIALMLDRLRCTYGNYVCSVHTDAPSELSGSSSSGSSSGSGGGVWRVSVEEGRGEALRKKLAQDMLLSPKSEPEDEVDLLSPQTPRRRASPAKSPAPLAPQPSAPVVHHIFKFPSIPSLSSATEAELRGLGMGYRAKFISGSAQFLASKEEGGAAWLQDLRDLSAAQEMGEMGETGVKVKEEESIVKEEVVVKKRSRTVVVKDESQGLSQLQITAQIQIARREAAQEARGANRMFVQSQLMLMPGVGKKVADCVALFSLDQVEAIPVDTHVWDIALRDYDTSLSLRGAKSITPAIYEEVGEVFRNRFPAKAGWAHSVLFAAELPEFRQRLPPALQAEMKAFSEQAKSAKKAGSAIKLELKREKEEKDERDRERSTPVSYRPATYRKRTAPSPADTAAAATSPVVTPARSASKRVKAESKST